jgi:hypothetical protein
VRTRASADVARGILGVDRRAPGLLVDVCVEGEVCAKTRGHVIVENTLGGGGNDTSGLLLQVFDDILQQITKCYLNGVVGMGA